MTPSPALSSPADPLRAGHARVASFQRTRHARSRASAEQLGFAFFLMLNAVLFVRPAEIVPELMGLPLYEALILACLACSLSPLFEQLRQESLRKTPVTVCVLGMLVAIVLSHLAHFNLLLAREGFISFAKVVLYYLLAVSLVNTPARLLSLFRWLSASITILTVLALLQYYNLINVPSLIALQEFKLDETTGLMVTVPRLRSTGLFNDPNDLCLILLLGGLTFLYWARVHYVHRPLFPDAPVTRRLDAEQFLQLVIQTVLRIAMAVLRTIVSIAVVAAFLYALALTRSRAGFLAMLVALQVLLWGRLGVKKAALVSALLLPAMLFLYGGRQTQISTKDGTGQTRIQLWSEGMRLLGDNPAFGIGRDQYVEYAGHEAHNSFVHCYAELGVVGGTFFIGLWIIAVATLFLLRKAPWAAHDASLRRLRPFLLALVCAYVAGYLTLSRPYVIPTYLVLALTVCYERIARQRTGFQVVPPVRWKWLCIYGGGLFVATTYVFIRVFARWGEGIE